MPRRPAKPPPSMLFSCASLLSGPLLVGIVAINQHESISPKLQILGPLSSSRQPPIHLFRHFAHQVQIRCQQGLETELSACAFSLAQIQNALKCGRVRTYEFRQPSSCVTARIRRFLVESNQRMPKKRTKGGSGCNQQLLQLGTPAAPSQEGLAQANHVRAPLPFDLQFVPSHRHFQFGEEIRALQHPMTRFHVQKLDRKYISGIPQLRECKQKRRWVALLPPPQSYRPQFL